MTPFKTQAHIHSLDGAIDEITVLDIKEDGRQTIYIVDYRGVKCSAIFNPFNCTYYADDVYGRINECAELSIITTTDTQGLYSDTAIRTEIIPAVAICSIRSTKRCKNSAKNSGWNTNASGSSICTARRQEYVGNADKNLGYAHKTGRRDRRPAFYKLLRHATAR